MLTGLDVVDWASMRHAYGSAEDVPGLILALCSPSSYTAPIRASSSTRSG